MAGDIKKASARAEALKRVTKGRSAVQGFRHSWRDAAAEKIADGAERGERACPQDPLRRRTRRSPSGRTSAFAGHRGPDVRPLFYGQLFQQQGLFAGLPGQETHGAQTGHAAAFVGQLHQIGKKFLVLDPGSLTLEQFV